MKQKKVLKYLKTIRFGLEKEYDVKALETLEAFHKLVVGNSTTSNTKNIELLPTEYQETLVTKIHSDLELETRVIHMTDLARSLVNLLKGESFTDIETILNYTESMVKEAKIKTILQ